MTATQEFVVPKSIPIILLIICFLFLVYYSNFFFKNLPPPKGSLREKTLYKGIPSGKSRKGLVFFVLLIYSLLISDI
jgi:hypothetical protein